MSYEPLNPDFVRSPCIGVCEIDRRRNWCRGCFRTMDEIIEWGSAPADQKRAILDRVDARRQSADAS